MMLFVCLGYIEHLKIVCSVHCGGRYFENNINQINSAQQASWSQTYMEELVTPSYAASCFRRELFLLSH